VYCTSAHRLLDGFCSVRSSSTPVSRRCEPSARRARSLTPQTHRLTSESSCQRCRRRGPEQGRRRSCDVRRATRRECLRSRGVRARSRAASARCGRLRAAYGSSGATSRVSPPCTCERTCNFSDVAGCSRRTAATARGLARHARHVTQRAGGEAGGSRAVPCAHRAATLATRGRATTSRHRRLE